MTFQGSTFPICRKMHRPFGTIGLNCKLHTLESNSSLEVTAHRKEERMNHKDTKNANRMSPQIMHINTDFTLSAQSVDCLLSYL